MVRQSDVLDINKHGSAFGDIVAIIDISLACCMRYAERNHGAPSFTSNRQSMGVGGIERSKNAHLVTSLMNAPRKGSKRSSSNVGM
jgi:hypothetical protein